MTLSDDDVRHVARLARLALRSEEVAEQAQQLDRILGYAEQVSEVATTDVPPTGHPFPPRNVLRPDEPGVSLPPDAVLGNAPAAEDGRFQVPRILGEEA